MKHYIIVKFKPEITKEEIQAMIPDIAELFENTTAINGIYRADVLQNCVNRANRADLMIRLEMDESALPEYDASVWHRQWKEIYGRFIEEKTIFDCQ